MEANTEIAKQIELLKVEQYGNVVNEFNTNFDNIKNNYDMGIISFQEKLEQYLNIINTAKKNMKIYGLENIQ